MGARAKTRAKSQTTRMPFEIPLFYIWTDEVITRGEKSVIFEKQRVAISNISWGCPGCKSRLELGVVVLSVPPFDQFSLKALSCSHSDIRPIQQPTDC